MKDCCCIPIDLGCVDGIVVIIKAPRLHEDSYICSNHYHVINVPAECNHKFKLINIVAKWPWTP